MAGSLRFFGGYAFGFFAPVFYQAIYRDYQKEYSLLNAGMAMLCFISAIGGGILSDRWRIHDPMTKAYIGMISSLGAVPFVAVCFQEQNNFWISISMLAGNYLISEAWASPTITMLLDSDQGGKPGLTISVYFLFATASGALSTFLVQNANIYLDALQHPSVNGSTLTAALLISYLGCVPAFYMAGRSYKKLKEE